MESRWGIALLGYPLAGAAGAVVALLVTGGATGHNALATDAGPVARRTIEERVLRLELEHQRRGRPAERPESASAGDQAAQASRSVEAAGGSPAAEEYQPSKLYLEWAGDSTRALYTRPKWQPSPFVRWVAAQLKDPSHMMGSIEWQLADATNTLSAEALALRFWVSEEAIGRKLRGIARFQNLADAEKDSVRLAVESSVMFWVSDLISAAPTATGERCAVMLTSAIPECLEVEIEARRLRRGAYRAGTPFQQASKEAYEAETRLREQALERLASKHLSESERAAWRRRRED